MNPWEALGVFLTSLALISAVSFVVGLIWPEGDGERVLALLNRSERKPRKGCLYCADKNGNLTHSKCDKTRNL